jgi:CDP-diacylglycerol--glycerol-3-phosphate 3-phosphatidyltransferase
VLSQEEKTAEASAHWTDEVGRRAPNILTFLRLLAVPVFVFLLIHPTPQSNLWATAIFVIASVTDWLDGYIARIYKAESILGTLLDPVADKILVMAALVMLSSSGPGARVQAWMTVCLLAREFLVSGLRSLAAVKGTVVAASRFAKHKTAWTMLAIVFLLVDGTYRIFGASVDFHFYGTVFLWIALAFSLSTGLDYAIKLRKMFL